jgi:hypothetical protein
MSISNLLVPNDLKLFCGDLTVDKNLTDITNVTFTNPGISDVKFNIVTPIQPSYITIYKNLITLSGSVEVTVTNITAGATAILIDVSIPFPPEYNVIDSLNSISGCTYEDTQKVNGFIRGRINSSNAGTTARLEFYALTGNNAYLYIVGRTYRLDYTFRGSMTFI